MLPAIRQFNQLRNRAVDRFPSANKGVVIILPFRINPGAQWFEYLLAYALRLRGYRPIMGMGESAVAYTDGYLCTRNRWLSRLPALWRSEQFSRAFQVENCSFKKLLGRRVLKCLRKEAFSTDKNQIPYYEKYGVCIGKQVMGSLSRYYLRCEVDPEMNIEVSREFLFTALVSLEAAKVMVEKYDPALLISSHGIYSSWGSFCEYFRSKTLPYVTWGFQYKKHSFILSHNNSYHRDIIEETPEKWKDYRLTNENRKNLIDYISSKGGSGSHSDNICYYSTDSDQSFSIRETLEIPPEKEIFGMFPNLGWDAQVSFRPLFFKNMNEWVLETIDWFVKHPEKVLIIRSHPAELRGAAETQEKVINIVKQRYASLPDNIHVIAPDSKISSYHVLESAAVCLVYGSKFGLEAAVTCKPLIICGEAYFRGKGMSYDPQTAQEYFSLLDRAPKKTPLTEEMYELALRYGYHYNFRRQFSIPLAELQGPFFKRYCFDSIEDLRPGGIPQLDDFINKCFSGDPFISENRS